MIYNTPKDMEIRRTATYSSKNTTPPKRTVSAAAASAPPTKHRQKRSRKQATIKKPVFKGNRAAYTKVAVFFLMLYFGTAVAFIIPLRPSYSASEKRNLSKFPEFSIKAFTSGTYFDDIGTWFSDTFPFRENLTKMNTALQSLSGLSSVKIHGDVENGDEIPDAPLDDIVVTAPETEPETEPVQDTTSPETTKSETKPSNVKVQSLGAILVAGNSAYEYYNFSNDLAPQFINLVSNIKSAAGNKANVYTIIAPTSIDITLNDAIRADANSSDQKKALDYFNTSFKNVTPVTDIYELMRLHRDEYIYFRTDHHWTQLGAYYAYTQFAVTKGFAPDSLSLYNEKTYTDFLGSFYSGSGQSKALSKTPDKIITYTPKADIKLQYKDTNGKMIDWKLVSDVTDYSQSNKYLTFIGGDQSYEKIVNNDIEEGESCLVIKESYGNAFVPFLSTHYKTIHVIDPRHYNGTLSDFTKNHKVDDIIFIANISTTRNSVYIDAMKDFIK